MTLARKTKDLVNIEKKLNKAAKEVIEKVAKEAGEDMKYKFKETMFLFYGDYDPVAYERWGGLPRAWELTYNISTYPHSEAEVKLNLAGEHIINGEEGFGKNIYDIPPRNVPIDADHVFSDAFEYGYHGHAEKLQTWDRLGGEPQEAIPPMSPPPKEIFDDWFKDYKRNIKTELGDFIAKECDLAIKRNLRKGLN